MFVLLLPAPAGAPEMFEAVAGQRLVVFSWSPPPVTLRNGVITSYTLSCSPSPSSLPRSPSQPGPLTVAGFSPDTSYSCSVVASNSVGSGPPANITLTTLQDRKVMCSGVQAIIIIVTMYVENDSMLKNMILSYGPEKRFRVTDCML